MNLDPDLDLSLDFDGEALTPARPRSVMRSRNATEKKGFTPPAHRATTQSQASPEDTSADQAQAKMEPTAKPKPTNAFKQPEAKNPWNVNNPKDLWDFFGMWLSILAAIQAYASYLIAGAISARDKALTKELGSVEDDERLLVGVQILVPAMRWDETIRRPLHLSSLSHGSYSPLLGKCPAFHSIAIWIRARPLGWVKKMNSSSGVGSSLR